jgi:chromate reductase
MKRKVFAISGSTRKDSANLQIIKAIAAMTNEKWQIEIFNDLALLPQFNPDIDKEGALPQIINEFRNKIQEADGVLICTPEYVFSLPGSLKNAIEWTVSTTVFSDKPVALITASASGIKAHESLLLIMETIVAKLSPKSQVLISGARAKLNANGQITDELTLNKIKELVADFEEMMHSAKG